MNITIDTNKPDDGTVAFNVVGEIDVFTSGALKDAIESAINDGSANIHIRLADVEYIDSTGLGVLINALKLAEENKSKIILVSPSHRVLRVFGLTGVTELFTITDPIDTAGQNEATSIR